MEQRTEEWFNARKHRITASAVGAIMGLAPYQTRDDVMRRMVREYHNAPNEFMGNAATEWGTFNEAGAIAEFEMETGFKVEPAPFVEYGDHFGASPDGYVSDGRLIEVKCPYRLRNGGEFKSIDDQKHYYAQIQMQLAATNHHKCYFYQWSPHGTKLEFVEYNYNFCAEMMIELEKFYDEYLIEREMPNAEKYLNDKTKKIFESELVEEYFSIKLINQKNEERQKEILQALEALTAGEGGIFGNHTFYKVKKDGTISYKKAIDELLPNADLSKYKGSPSEFWVLK